MTSKEKPSLVCPTAASYYFKETGGYVCIQGDYVGLGRSPRKALADAMRHKAKREKAGLTGQMPSKWRFKPGDRVVLTEACKEKARKHNYDIALKGELNFVIVVTRIATIDFVFGIYEKDFKPEMLNEDDPYYDRAETLTLHPEDIQPVN